MQRLNYHVLSQTHPNDFVLKKAPVRVLQFGEGNFLRGFVDYFIDMLNEKAGFNGKVAVVQPIANGLSNLINEQEGLYTLYLRGIENGEKINARRVISCIDHCLNPYSDFDAFLKEAHNPDLRFIVSNTTEAGIVYSDDDQFDDVPPNTFPAKLTRLLFERFTAFEGRSDKGVIVLSCELIDNNGAQLKQCVMRYAERWQLGDAFMQWLNDANIFCSTLVDRIVTGYPRDEVQSLWEENGYEDQLINTAEVFGFWVIEGPDSIGEELAFAKAGLPVIITNDHTPYKKRKVRILNGAHTSMVPAAYLAGQDIVRDCMHDDVIGAFLHRAMFDEIIPTLTLPKDELEGFANSVIERFKNPYIDHRLLSITLNSFSKWRARVMPSVKEYAERFGKLPRLLTFSFAALMQFYTGAFDAQGKYIGKRGEETYEILDDKQALEFCAAHCADIDRYVESLCAATEFWGEDLSLIPGFAQQVKEDLALIRSKGMKAALQTVVG